MSDGRGRRKGRHRREDNKIKELGSLKGGYCRNTLPDLINQSFNKCDARRSKVEIYYTLTFLDLINHIGKKIML